MSKSIYSKGFIYEGVDDNLLPNEKRDHSKYWGRENSTDCDGFDRDAFERDIERHLQSLPYFPVLNSHNFKEGEDVTGKYELQYQWVLGFDTPNAKWVKCSEAEYKLPLFNTNDKRRIVAIAINQSPTTIEEVIDKNIALFKGLQVKARHELDGGAILRGEQSVIDNLQAKGFSVPPPAHTQQGEISAMQAAVLEFDNQDPNEPYTAQQVTDYLSSLLAKEREQHRSTWNKGVEWGDANCEFGGETSLPKFDAYFTTHYSNTKQ